MKPKRPQQRPQPRPKTVSIAFSGSGFLIPAHAGLASCLLDHGYSFDSIAGTSGGSIIGACIASGMTSAEIKTLAVETDYSKLLKLSPMSVFRGRAYCDGQALLDFLTENFRGKTFRSAKFPCHFIATDIGTQKPFVFSQETTPDTSLALACRASSSVPFMYESVNYDGQILMDGGLVNNIPVTYLKKGSLMIGADVEGTPSGVPKNLIQLAGALINILLSANENTQKVVAQEAGAHLIQMNTGSTWFLDTHMGIEEKLQLFQMGYSEGLKWLETQSSS